ncbi:hypothetical protein Hanom_Chr05g00468351 [Helianthus anomalus]
MFNVEAICVTFVLMFVSISLRRFISFSVLQTTGKMFPMFMDNSIRTSTRIVISS